jgi:hypothetical protein
MNMFFYLYIDGDSNFIYILMVVQLINTMSPPIHLKLMTLRRFRRGNLLMGHPFKLFSLTVGPHTSVTDIKEVKIEP